MTILAPSSAQELQVMLDDALSRRWARWPSATRRAPARQVRGRPGGRGAGGPPGAAGADVCILAVGPLLEAAEEAARLLAAQGVDATVWDVRAVKPLDPAMLADAAGHRLVVTVEDGVLQGGAGSAVARALAGDPVPVLTLGVPDEYIPHGSRARILARLGLDASGIAASIVAALGGSASPSDSVSSRRSRARRPVHDARAGRRLGRIDVETTLPLAVHPRSEEIEQRCYDRVRPLLNEHFGNESLAERYIRQRMALWACACYPAHGRRPVPQPAGHDDPGRHPRRLVQPARDDAERGARGAATRPVSAPFSTRRRRPTSRRASMLHEAMALVTPQMSCSLKERYVDSFRQIIDSRVLEAAGARRGHGLDFDAYMKPAAHRPVRVLVDDPDRVRPRPRHGRRAFRRPPAGPGEGPGDRAHGLRERPVLVPQGVRRRRDDELDLGLPAPGRPRARGGGREATRR